MPDELQPAASEYELVLARAFDLAWNEFVEIEGEPENTAENRGSLAARIVVLARSGESEEANIGAGALLYLRALAAARRPDRRLRRAVRSDKRPDGASLDQEAIDAASGALEACLEELPEGIAFPARSVLTDSILENAGQGERNRDVLRKRALEALKARR